MSQRNVRFALLILVPLLIINLTAWWLVDDRAKQRWSESKGLRVVAFTPDTADEDADRIGLIFNRPVIEENRIGQWLEESPFALIPALPGRWRWAATDRLEFMPEEQMPAGRRIMVSLRQQAARLLGAGLEGQKEFEVAPKPLEIDRCEVRSSDHTHITFAISFSLPVEPKQLLRHMKVRESDGDFRRELEFTLLTDRPDRELIARVRQPRATGQSLGRLNVHVSAALEGTDSDQPLGRDAQFQLQADTPLSALRVDAHRPGLEETISVGVTFNQPLGSNADAQVRLSPAVEGLAVSTSYNQLRLTGRFEPGSAYTVVLPPTIVDRTGRTLAREQTLRFSIPDRRPSMRFDPRGGILSPRGHLRLDLNMVNTQGFELKIDRVYESNLAFHLASSRGRFNRSDMPTSTTILEKQVQIDTPRNVPVAATIDLQSLLGEVPPGVYNIEARARDRYWSRAQTTVTITEMGLTAKRSRGEVVAWLTGLDSALPIADAAVTVYCAANQILARGTTDAQGFSRLALPEGVDGSAPWLVVAESGRDRTHLQLDRRQWVVEDVSTTGRAAPELWDAMLYSDRGVYRPGESIHLTGIVRRQDHALPEDMPFEVEVYRPDGRIIARHHVMAKARTQGMFHATQPLDEAAPMGRYTFRLVLPGGGRPIGSVDALVEAFLPVRIEAKATPEREWAGPDDLLLIDIQADYLIGRPAAGLEARIEGRWLPAPFTASGELARYRFGPADSQSPVSIRTQTAVLDPDGHARFQTLSQPEEPGRWQGHISVTVIETGGRSVSASTRVTLDQFNHHIGVRLPPRRVIQSGKPFDVSWVVRDGQDQAIPSAKTRFELLRLEREYVLEQRGQNLQWQTVERISSVWSDLATGTEDGAPSVLSLSCPEPGLYRLRATSPETGAVTESDFFASDHGMHFDAFPSERPERLRIMPDREEASPGDLVTINVQSPFAGTLLLTMETDRVIDHRVIAMSANTVNLQWRVPAEVRSTVFFAATVIRGADHESEAWLPRRALGMARMEYDRSGHRLTPTITATDEARPGQDVDVQVRLDSWPRLDRPPMIHLWAVDEGILLAAGYNTPDPIRHFFAPRRAEVISTDVFSDLLPDHQRPTTTLSIGGDDEESASMAARRSPVSVRGPEPAIIWLKAAPLGDDGVLNTKLSLPDYTGRLRIMAVAVDEDRFGSAQKPLTVTQPLMMEVAWPRAVAPGDHFSVPIRIFNTTDKPMTVRLRIMSNEHLGIDLAHPEQARITIPAESQVLVGLAAHAESIGVAESRIIATVEDAPELSLEHKHELSIRPAAPLQAVVSAHRMEAGERLQLEPDARWMAGTERITVRISGRPTIDLLPLLDSLLAYPHGCAEQTASQLLAMMSAPRLLEADGRAEAVSALIEAGIDRLWGMQTRHGGIAYWPGDSRPDPWVSAYTAEVLVRAGQAGVRVDPRMRERLAEYLEAELNAIQSRRMDPGIQALICRALAGLGRPSMGWMARLTDQIEHLDRAARLDLAHAWYRTGRRDQARAVLDQLDRVDPARTTHVGRLTSSIVERGQQLELMAAMQPKAPRTIELAQNLLDLARTHPWMSTLEQASLIQGIHAYLERDDDEQGNCEVMVWEGVRREILREIVDEGPFTIRRQRFDQPLDIEARVQGSMYLNVVREGIPADGRSEEVDQGLRVIRRWLDREGNAIDPVTLAVGDLIIVEVSINATDVDRGEAIQNVAIVDVLPGGVEVENPRLMTSAEAARANAPTADRVEFLDDRVVLFTTVGRNVRTFRYPLRVTTEGRFTLPPIEASAMYAPATRSINGGGEIFVER
ncbi:MAG: hypothetical protein JJU36_17610 [Phycisphaeraceae bacterium]|nr:hypothetical protein [Phycisphaeraceae bacterium]